MTISALRHFPDVCRLCLQHKPAQEMIPLVSNAPELDAQLSELMEEFCATVPEQESTALLPSAVCDHCQQQLLTAYKFKRRVTFLQEFQMALAAMRHRNEPEPLRQKFLNDYEYMSSLFRELNLLEQEQALRWEDLLMSQPEEATAEEGNVSVIVDDESGDKYPQILHVEIVDDAGSDGGYTYHSEGSMDQDGDAEIEYIDVEPVVEAGEAMIVVEQTEGSIEEQPSVVAEKAPSEDSLEYLPVDVDSGPIEWECDIAGCDQRFDDNEQFIRHKKDVHQCCICTICGIVLKNKYSLEVHTRRHTGKTNFTCRYCPSTFYTSQEYKLHLGLVHVATDTVNCDVCGLEFKNSTCLKRHLKSHSEERSYQCPFCEKAFKTNMHLHRHKETIHMKLRFKCNHCDVSYGRKDKLRMHIERAHNIQMYFLCDICLKSYSTEEERQEHMSHHDNPQPLECGTCLMAFITPEEFHNHLCISYRENYVCCSRDFKFHTFYNKHMFLVHGEKTNARVKPTSNQLIANIRAERKQEERCGKCEKIFRTRKQKNAHKLECRGKQQNDTVVERSDPSPPDE
nr:zinc finger protein 184-like [Aedes albopictus]